jgi:hypothetical protein
LQAAQSNSIGSITLNKHEDNKNGIMEPLDNKKTIKTSGIKNPQI